MRIFRNFICRRGNALVAILMLATGATAFAGDERTMLAPYVSDDTFAVLRLDVSAIPLPTISQEHLDTVLKLPGQLKDMGVGLIMAEAFVKRVKEAGAEQVYAVIGLGDLHDGGGPLLLFTTRADRVRETERALKSLLQEIINDPSSGHWRTDAQDIETRQAGVLVVAGTKSAMQRYTSAKPVERNDLLAPLAKLADEKPVLSGVFCPGPDFRRVVRELWPKLPGVLAPLSGELADRWISLEGSINLPPNLNPKLALQTKDPEAAEIFAKLWRDMPAATAEFGDPSESSRMVQGYAQLLVTMLPAKVDGTRVNIGFPSEASQFAQLGSMVSDAADKSMESSRRVKRINSLRQLILAMFNYESANKHLPPAAICDKDGKPLLSWRVAVLPFLGEMELYNQFHLNEAWDSPHNLPLIEKMPDIFVDPDPRIQSSSGAGKTTYEVPVGKETIFFSNEGATFREITDGAANTIAIIQVDPQQAVEWTRPSDWKVDLARPTQALGNMPNVIAAYADGHVQSFQRNKLSDDQLRAQLTRAGGESVEH